MKNGKWKAAWMICGIISVICAAVIPYVGWYACGNIAVLLSGYYAVSEAQKRTNRLLENKQLLKKMSKHQKDSFVNMDRQETKNIQAMTNMMLPIITACNICLNIYCYIYYGSAKRIIFPMTEALASNTPLCIVLLVLDASSALLFYLALRKDVDLIMRYPDTIYPAKHNS